MKIITSQMKLAKGRKTYLHLKRKNGLTFKNTNFFFLKLTF